MSTALRMVEDGVYAVKGEFEMALSDRTLNFEREAGFAMQVFSSNDYATKIARSNPDSVVHALRNIAAIGISLNPAKKQAYLVPRDGKICLDLSYMGLIEIAVASGSVLWAQAKLVHANDTFQLNGLGQAPTHGFNPFGTDRGALVGCYVVAKLPCGDHLVETMQIDEIYAIRDRSTAWKAWIKDKKKCPWVTDEGEMVRKTVIKRAYKYWPKTDRMSTAIDYLDSHAGEGLANEERVNGAVAGAFAAAAGQERPKFDLQHWISRVNEAKTVADAVAIHGEAMGVAAKALDRDGAAAFKKAAIARRTQLQQELADNTFEHGDVR